MENIIKFAYTGSISWDEVDNLLSFIKDADFLELDDVKDQGIKILMSNLDPQNALDAYHLSNICNSIILKNKSQEFILQNFDVVSASDEFQKLDIAIVKDILTTQPRNRCTQKIFEGILRWIVRDSEARKVYLSELFALLPFGLMNCKEVIRIATDEDILAIPLEHK